jgi:hypothetical protein
MATTSTRTREPEKSEREDKPVEMGEARRKIGDLAMKANLTDRIIPLNRRGKRIAALIGLEDLAFLRKHRGTA